MANLDEYDIRVPRSRPSASLYLLYLLLGGVSTFVTFVLVVAGDIGRWGNALGTFTLLGLVIFMGYSLVKLADALLNKGRD
jgi:uncharacterized membrane protein